MVLFTFNYDHSIDAKNRLAIPSEIRTQLQEELGNTDKPIYLYVMLTDGKEGPALCLYTEEGFKRLASELDHSERPPEQVLEIERLIYSMSQRVQIDKQGRMLLPEKLLKRSRLGSDVVLMGVKDHMEIRDRKTWTEYVERTLREKPEILMNLRLAMRAAPTQPASSVTTDQGKGS